jgi:hypothetical protein
MRRLWHKGMVALGLFRIRRDHHRRRKHACPRLRAMVDMGDLAMHYLLFGRLGGL